VSTRAQPDEAFSSELPRAIGRPADAALVANGITTLDQVATMTEQQLLALHGVGPKAISILQRELAATGRRLAAERAVET